MERRDYVVAARSPGALQVILIRVPTSPSSPLQLLMCGCAGADKASTCVRSRLLHPQIEILSVVSTASLARPRAAAPTHME